MILARDQYRCRLRVPRICIGQATCVHHVRGKAAGDDPRFLLAACAPCNLHVGEPGSKAVPHTRVSTW